MPRPSRSGWHNNRAKMSSKVGMAEPVRICSWVLSNFGAKFNKSENHKDLIHVGQVGLGISSSFGHDR